MVNLPLKSDVELMGSRFLSRQILFGRCFLADWKNGSRRGPRGSTRRAVDEQVQIIFKKDLSAEEQDSTMAWGKAKLKLCPNHSDGACGSMGLFANS